MQVQHYVVSIQPSDSEYVNLTGAPVYLNEHTNDVMGIVVDDNVDLKIRTICLFQPTTNPNIIKHVKNILSHKMTNAEVLTEIRQTRQKLAPFMERNYGQLLDKVEKDLLSKMESMGKTPMLSDVLYRRVI